MNIFPKRLATNSLLSLFLSIHRNQKQESNFQEVGGLVTRNISLLVIASRALLRSSAEFNKLLQPDFLTCYSCSYYSSMLVLSPPSEINILSVVEKISFSRKTRVCLNYFVNDCNSM